MKTLNPTQRACLEAMGIDVWVSRENSNEELNTEKAEYAKDEQASEVISVAQPALAEVESLTSEVENKPATESSAQLDVPQNWQGLKATVSNCTRCSLHSSRIQTVFGSGNEKADWLIIGDKPSEADNTSGEPFSDKAGELLTAMLRSIGLTRQQVYVANTLKCITPNNREPEASESEACLQYLKQQINLIQPKLILVVGQSAAQRLLGTHSTMARLRQKVHSLESINIPVVVTYHPSYLLSMPADKGKAWQDLLFANKVISTEAVL